MKNGGRRTPVFFSEGVGGAGAGGERTPTKNTNNIRFSNSCRQSIVGPRFWHFHLSFTGTVTDTVTDTVTFLHGIPEI